MAKGSGMEGEEMIILAPVKVGSGKQVHAATFEEVQKGRHMVKLYRQLCSSGKSTLMHSHHTPSIRPLHGLTVTDVNCQKCLDIMNRINNK